MVPCRSGFGGRTAVVSTNVSWYRFEPHGKTEVTIFTLEAGLARTGARGTCFFKGEVLKAPDPKRVVEDALALMPRWPTGKWPRPAGLRPVEQAIVLPALEQALGRAPSRPSDWTK